MHTFWITLAGLALAELGDKTQLLALLLAARYRRPWPIVLGIALATLLGQSIAAVAGASLGSLLTPALQRWVVGLALLLMALWALLPERSDAGEPRTSESGHGVLLASAIAFFVAELGDKTQVATLMLGADLHPLWQVIIGSSAGMLLVNVPTVWLGARYAARIPLRLVRTLAALLFAVLGLWVLLR